MRVLKSFLLMLLAYISICFLFPIFLIPCIIVYKIKGHDICDYFYTIAVGFDQAGGSVLYNEEDWTISGYTYHLAKNKGNVFAVVFMKFIDFIFGRGHCKKAYKNELAKISERIIYEQHS